MTVRIAWIALTPVKATALHIVDEIELLERGPEGDRRFYLVTEAEPLPFGVHAAVVEPGRVRVDDPVTLV